MRDEQLERLEARLANLERWAQVAHIRLTAMERIISRARGAMPSAPEETVSVQEPPPIVTTAKPPTHVPPSPHAPDRLNEVEIPKSTGAGGEIQRDTEYVIGAKLLPKIGAILVLLGLLFFVAWGYSAGWITPTMVFIGEIVFCLGFIAVGQWKRQEKEDYGQILTGIGSCGLYLTFAGGYFVYSILSDTSLVGLCIALSLANLTYGLFSRSRAFLAIGIIGGFASAFLPMQGDHWATAAYLHVTIAIVAAVIIGIRRWPAMAILLWLASTVALVGLLISEAAWQLRVSTLYVASLAAAIAYAFAYVRSSFDPRAAFVSVALFAAALIGLAVEHDRIGASHLVLLGLGSALAAILIPKENPVRKNLLLTAVAIPATIAPFCYSNSESIAIFLALSLVASLIGLGTRSRIAAGFGIVDYALSLFTYVVVESWKPLSASIEAWTLSGLILVLIAAAWASARNLRITQGSVLVALALTMPLIARLSWVTLTGTALAPTPYVSVTGALGLFVFATAIVAAATRWTSAIVAMWLALGVAAIAYIQTAIDEQAPLGHDFGLALILTTAVLAVSMVRPERAVEIAGRTISTVAAVLIGFLAMRLSWVIAQIQGYNPALVTALTAAAYSGCASILTLFRRNPAAMVSSWILLAGGGLTYLRGIDGGWGVQSEMAVLTALLGGFILATAAIRPEAAKQPDIWHAVALLGWGLFTRWVDVGLTWTGTDVRVTSTVTVAWIAYALVLLTLGFALEVRQLRFWSMGVMFTTVCKILLIDLASTSVPFRVGVLVGLGLLMLGGGYWYIQGRSAPPRHHA